ncbi:hypothetical protein [Stenotrophomonas sp. VV52]|uniref:hypothetical protein n=1 Tax=Stenotrophomonas sp. VV52 TaxID=2066958 RepID=UPI000C9DFBC2|nr:hypothetical protein [Stenotrophomonas sp. VV52]
MTFATRNVGAARFGLAVLHVFLLGMAMAALLYVNVPANNENALMLLIGALVANNGGIGSYYFGNNSRARGPSGG